MNDFYLFSQLGWHHIISLDAIDHLLFLAVLISLYRIQQWKQVLILVTAFTIGHTLTLLLSLMNFTRFNGQLTEFIISLTIVSTGIFNLFHKQETKNNYNLNYLLALIFGLIHGLGFANNIRFMMASGQNLIVPLISFNIGIETGQLIFVMCLLFTQFYLTGFLGIKHKWWITAMSISSIIIGIFIGLQRWPF